MKTNLFRSAPILAGMAAIGLLLYESGIRAQQGPTNPNVLSTNWMGYLVLGREDKSDSIARGPFPFTERQVEIGLRSDGIVIWRQASP